MKNNIVIGGKKKRGFIADWVYTIFWAGLIAIIFRSLLLEPFNIPSGSMIPNLMVGDHLFVSKWNYGYSRFSMPFGSMNLFGGRFLEIGEPKHGDIIVFRKPGDRIEYVKRLIGMPGDTVQMIEGQLYLNGQIVPRTNQKRYVVANVSNANRNTGINYNDMRIVGNKIYIDGALADFNYTIEYKNERICLMNPRECRIEEGLEYTETLPNGKSYQIIKLDDIGQFDNTPLFVVPAGHYFMMGDNRDRSGDSRLADLGFINYDNFLGRVWFIFYSHNYYTPLLFVWDWMDKMRWDRFGLFPK